jgi:Rrf2 family protein
MRMTEGVEWAAHCTVVLALLPPGATLPAAALAEYHGVPGPYLAKSLQALARDGLVASVPGRGGGYRLGRPADAITLEDVVAAVDGPGPLFRCTEIRQRGPARAAARSYSPVCAIAGAMGRAEDAWRAELRRTTVADIARQVGRQAPPVAVDRGIRWLATRMSTGPATA